ncbi:sigma-70 family RNA polymerase sigma factor [Planctomycetales bacterium ZRK34]|nr:sigma-70 family RNA polymerase sigma factor [Planctomycetales bacterium ZRK34]
MALDQQTIVRILLAERSGILSYLLAISSDIHAAEDVFQDLVIKVTQKQPEIADRGHVLAWARAAGRNALIDTLRTRQRRRVVFDTDVLDQLEADWQAFDQPGQATRVDALRQCLSELNPKARRLIEMRYADGLSGQQMAQSLKRPRGSLYVSLSRVYRVLADCVRRRMEVADG